jgi:dethiobiotin synthetase
MANCVDPQMQVLAENIATLDRRLDCSLLGVMLFGEEMDVGKYGLIGAQGLGNCC